MLKLSLRCTNTGLKSKSLKAVAKRLSTKVGYKVWRTLKLRKKQFTYGQSCDKLTQYQYFAANNLPALQFTQDMEQAKQWASTSVVFGRKLLNASCGHGIVIFESPENVTPCPVYTLYKKKKREFRVHVFKDSVVTVVEKKRKAGFEGERDTKIRNLANGYVFVQQVENLPEGINELALKAAKVSQSDFKGVDIGYNEKKNELFVIEVNSAPGIVGNNVDKYVQEIIKHV